MGEGGLPCCWKVELFCDLESTLLHERRIYTMGIARRQRSSFAGALEMICILTILRSPILDGLEEQIRVLSD